MTQNHYKQFSFKLAALQTSSFFSKHRPWDTWSRPTILIWEISIPVAYETTSDKLCQQHMIQNDAVCQEVHTAQLVLRSVTLLLRTPAKHAVGHVVYFNQLKDKSTKGKQTEFVHTIVTTIMKQTKQKSKTPNLTHHFLNKKLQTKERQRKQLRQHNTTQQTYMHAIKLSQAHMPPLLWQREKKHKRRRRP